MKLVAVTSCPTGIAHTYMAAEALEQAAEAAGHEISVETQGAAGATPLTEAQIAEADAVVFAADVDVRDKERFAGKPTVTGSVKRAINDAAGLIAEAVSSAESAPTAGAARAGSAAASATTTPARTQNAALSFGSQLRQWLMTGVSYMIPFVAAGGILIALSFVLGGAEIAAIVNGGTFQGTEYPGVSELSNLFSEAGFAGVLFKLGAEAFSMLVPILAGFIAFGMADRMGIAPGVVGGLIAVAIGAGFLGGLVAGLLAGAVTLGLKQIKVPRGVAGIMPVVVIPLLSVFAVGFLMLVVVGGPIATVQSGLTDWLSGLAGVNAILLGALLGAMMGFDLGGPVNKVAYLFGTAALASDNLTVMAAVMAAGMVPPLGLALATVIRRKLFTQPERQAGEAAWLLGLSFITEGAIPFAAADPLRVIPSTVAGGAAAGATSMAVGSTLMAPHGGIWVIGLIGNPFGYLLAILVGTAVTCGVVVAAKHVRRGTDEPTARAEPSTSPQAVAA
ncbi:fructose-specific PTS transporter subunit EIIC [Haloechinothrix salitolerans]|uniref:PTS fructose transporter subunit IIC n=1 Tax=Haloechinothrix salitolerans TaxID=926830 RepID=A0ABW2C766_9PSEU